MTSRISDYQPSNLPPSVQGPGGGSHAVGNSGNVGSTSAAPGGDTVTLTGSSITLQKLNDAVANAPVVDSQRVAAARLAIKNGTYQINARSIAEKLLQAESGLKKS